MSADAAVINPFNWAYRQYHLGNFVHPVKFSFMAKNYYENVIIRLLEDCCKVLNQIAVSSSKLTPHQRRKYAANKVNKSSNVFYLFPCERIPFDVYERVQPIEGTYIYQ
jgi:hypothetical protein